MLQRKNLYLENIAVFRSKEKNLFDKNQLHRLEEKLLEKGIYMTGPVILHNRDVQNTDYELLISVNRTEGIEEERFTIWTDQDTPMNIFCHML